MNALIRLSVSPADTPRRAILPLLLLVLLSPGADLAWAADSAPVRVAGVDYLADLPTVIALHEGLFAPHGLDADVEFNDSGRRNLERLRAGETDFALMALAPIVLDRLADPSPGEADDPVILASLVHSTRLNHVVVPVPGPVEHPADLRGRRVGLRKGTDAEFVWWLFAHFHGFDPASVELVDYAVARIPQALREGEVAAAVIWEPWLSRLREPGGAAFRSFSGSNIYDAQWVLVTTRASAREQPGRSRAVLAAYRDAIASIHRDPEAAINVYARHADIPEEILRHNWPALDYALNLRWSFLANLQQQVDWGVRAGHGHATDRIAVLDLIDTTALRGLDPFVVAIPPGSADPEPPP
jgi:ABC-type nitrate/sulfonate/bicarbonate transport system substrate-binding protein